MIRVKFISSIIAMLILFKGYSQSIVNPIETLKKKREIVYGLDNRRTHIHQQHTVIYGLYTGIGFGKKLKFKIGINGTPFEVGRVVDENGIVKKNRLFFVSLGEEFDFYQYKKFGITSYLQAGFGYNFYRQLNQSGTELNKAKQLIIPMETGFNFSYDLLSYLKLKTGFGWRFVSPNNARDLSGYYVKLGLSFNIRKYYDLIENKNKTSR